MPGRRYGGGGFVGGMAGNAIQEFLMQREQANRQQQMDALLAERQAAELKQRERQMQLQEQEAKAQAERQTRMDTESADAKAAQQRQAGNVAGVRSMMADAMTQGPLTPDAAKTIGIMGFREGIAPPAEVSEMLKPDDRARDLADYEAKAMIDASVQTPERFRTVGGSIFDTQSEQFRTPPDRGDGSGAASGGAKSNASSDYGVQTAERVIEAIDGVLPKINGSTAGILGNASARLGVNQGAIDVSAELQTVAGNIAFNALQQMRNASKTGGALGSVAQQELQLLQSVEGSLRQDQSPANLKAQLEKVRASMERFKTAQSLGGSLDMRGTPNPSGNGGGVVKWGRDANGRPVRLK